VVKQKDFYVRLGSMVLVKWFWLNGFG
jgi:hypothetical protein